MIRISFIGLGHMGNPMVSNLLKAGYRVKIYDVVPAAMQALIPKGAIAAQSLADLATEADVIITMLQTGKQVSEICLGTEGIFKHALPGTVYIDCSSIEIMLSHQLHAEAKKSGINMVDAPVSGGVVGASGATLTFMVGGSVENVFLAKPILEKMGKKIIHAGSEGHGQAAKICNNLILGISMIGVCEAFNLGEKLGLDPKKLFEISSNASGQCWSLTNYCPVPGLVENAPSNHSYTPGFMTKMMLKDLRLAQQAAQSSGATLPLGAHSAELYALFVEQGYGEMDFSGIINLLR